MATAFSFPASPVTGQLVSLPDGNQAQWNGYAWVEFGASGITTYITDATPPSPKYGDRWIRPASMTEVVWVPNAGTAGVWVDLMDAGSVAYPIPIAKGGTGATTAAQARINLGINSATGEFIIPKDGTAALPGMAWVSAPTDGWYRGAGGYGYAVGGVVTHSASSTASNSYFSVFPRAVGGTTELAVYGANTVANGEFLGLGMGGGVGFVRSITSGGTPLLPLNLQATQVRHPDGSASVPGIAFDSERGTGWFRVAANTAALAIAGAGSRLQVDTLATTVLTTLYVVGSPTATFSLNAAAGGTANLLLNKSGTNVANNIYGYNAGKQRWIVQIGSEATESGSNTGSPFNINRYDDAGNYLGNPFRIARNTGDAVFEANLTVSGSAYVTNNVNAKAVTVQSPTATINLIKSGSTQTCDIWALSGASVPRWLLRISNEAAESGANVGSDFAIHRYSDTGAYLGNGLNINRASGAFSIANNLYVASGSAILQANGSFNWNPSAGDAGLVSTSYVAGTYRNINIWYLNPGEVGHTQYLYNPGVEGLFRFNVISQSFDMRNSGQGSSALGWVAGSDRRRKANIVSIEGALAKLLTLGGYTYDKLDAKGLDGVAPRKAGYIAQEVQAVLPEAVVDIGAVDGEESLAVDHNAVIGLIINAMRELNAKVEALA